MLDLSEAQKYGITLQTVMRRHIRELERLQQRIEKSPHPERGHLLLQATAADGRLPTVTRLITGCVSTTSYTEGYPDWLLMLVHLISTHVLDPRNAITSSTPPPLLPPPLYQCSLSNLCAHTTPDRASPVAR